MDSKELVEVSVNPPKQKRPNRSAQLQKELNIVEPGDGGLILRNALELYSLPKIDTDNPKEVDDRTTLYFEITDKNGIKPSLAGYALALGIDRTTLRSWVIGRTNKPIDVVNTIKRAYDILTLSMEDYMLNGKINPVSGIFLMKNNFGYKDQSDVVITPVNPLGEMQSREEIEKRYAEDMIVDVDYTDVAEGQ